MFRYIGLILLILSAKVFADNLDGGLIGTSAPPVGWREEASSDLVRPRVIITDVNTIVDNNDGSINFNVASGDLMNSRFVNVGGDVLSGVHNYATATLRIPDSATLPSACSVGDIYMDTDATSGQRMYLCESANTWALQGDGGGSGDVTDVGDCATGACFSGTSGATLTFNNASGDQTLSFDNTTQDFELSNDLSITDPTPHLQLIDNTAGADDFEQYADGGRFYLTNVSTNAVLMTSRAGDELIIPAKKEIKTIIINSPTASGDGAAVRMPLAGVIKQVNVLCVSGTNWVGHLDICDANGGACAGVDGGTDITATAGTGAQDDGALSAASFGAGAYVGAHTTSVSGTPTRAIVTFLYTVNDQ